MKRAYIYIRVSTEDQRDNWSVAGQEQSCTQFCQRKGYEVVQVWKDEGKSGKSFDRPAWMEMQASIKKQKIDFIVVNKYDRFSRNVTEGLQMFERLEAKYGLRVLSVVEDFGINPFSPLFWQLRTDALVRAELERKVITDRVAGGRFYGAKAGRWMGPAPYGYDNARDEQGKPVLIENKKEADTVRKMFDAYLIGRTFAEIKTEAKARGWNSTHKEAVKRVISNPVYAGLIVTPEYQGEGNQYVQGMHRPIVSENIFWQVQDKLNGKVKKRHEGDDLLPLRGLILCQCCGKLLTGSRSRGQTGMYWHYYRCLRCRGQNFREKVAHAEIVEILQNLSFSKVYMGRLILETEKAVEKLLKDRQAGARQAKAALSEVEAKMDTLEEKYLIGKIDEEFYNRWNQRYRVEMAEKRSIIERASEGDAATWKRVSQALPKLADLPYIWEACQIADKARFLRLLFGNEVEKLDKGYRTSFVNPIISHNMQNTNLLQIKNGTNLGENSAVGSIRSPYGTIIEPLIADFQPLMSFLLERRA